MKQIGEVVVWTLTLAGMTLIAGVLMSLAGCGAASTGPEDVELISCERVSHPEFPNQYYTVCYDKDGNRV